MALNSFTPSTKIESAKVNANFTNLSDHARYFTMRFGFPGVLQTQTQKDILQLPDNGLIERVDLVVDTAPTGASLIVDIQRSTDSGANWSTIFTNSANRPVITAGNKAGNTTTIDVPAVTGNSTLFRAVISQVGSSVAGSDLSVMVKGKYNLD